MLSLRKESKVEKKKSNKWCRKGDSLAVTNSHHSGGMVCTADQCTLPPKISANTPSSTPQPFFEEKAFTHAKLTPFDKSNSSFIDDESQKTLFSMLPPDLHDAMQQAAKNALLPAFLSSLTQEFLTDYLKPRHYSASQIYYIHQAVRALLVIALGATAARTLASTGVGLLSRKCLGDKYSGYASSVAMLAYDFYLDPANMVKTGAAFASSLGSGWLVSSLTSHGVFRLKAVVGLSPQNNVPQPPVR